MCLYASSLWICLSNQQALCPDPSNPDLFKTMRIQNIVISGCRILNSSDSPSSLIRWYNSYTHKAEGGVRLIMAKHRSTKGEVFVPFSCTCYKKDSVDPLRSCIVHWIRTLLHLRWISGEELTPSSYLFRGPDVKSEIRPLSRPIVRD